MSAALLPLTVAANTPGGPTFVIANAGGEASIRLVAGPNPDTAPNAWHIGVGGGAGPGVVFFWNPTAGIVATLDLSGNLTVQNLKVSTLVIPKNDNAPNAPNVQNPQLGQILWDNSSIWIYTGQWEKAQIGPPS